ncbi:hypothetical protein WS70_13385 [Burkholderia mayonis]|uniref:Uncharacterized protein n=2 Tax=Burkholderia mayonis TaxID=1385591 RepID=A0A1B4FIX2_9BURK|nr:hypothetical protein WS70_13385 [Burkholderia mayonis]KVE45074.1 hypothetical protein WS70_05445 [Burkholderia mayonis]
MDDELKKIFVGAVRPETTERIGVMSVDSFHRQWVPVVAEDGYLVAKARNGKTALLGRVCKRDDGKFCLEVMVRAEIENNKLRHYEFWYVDPADEQRHSRRLDMVMRDHISM